MPYFLEELFKYNEHSAIGALLLDTFYRTSASENKSVLRDNQRVSPTDEQSVGLPFIFCSSVRAGCIQSDIVWRFLSNPDGSSRTCCDQISTCTIRINLLWNIEHSKDIASVSSTPPKQFRAYAPCASWNQQSEKSKKEDRFLPKHSVSEEKSLPELIIYFVNSFLYIFQRYLLNLKKNLQTWQRYIIFL